MEQGWGQVLRVGAARAVLSMLVSLLIWSLLPAVIGWTPRVILSGSMQPRIHVGDVIVTREVPTATLVKGQVLTVKDPDHPGITRTHRMVRRDADGSIVTRGDANRQADSSHVSDDAVLGMGVIRVPYVGRPMYWVAERNWLALGGTVALLGLCLFVAFPGKPKREDDTDSDHAGTGRAGRGRRVAAVVTIGVVTAGALAGPAEAAFRKSVGNNTSFAAASTFYPYRTAVLADSPSFFWRLAEASGTAIADAGTSARPGTLVGPTYVQAQAGALAAEPRDTSLLATMASITANVSVTGPATFSVEAWIKTTSTTGGRILGFGDASGANQSATVDRQLYLAPTGKVMFGVGSTKTTVASTAAVNNGAWHHVVGTSTTGNNGMKLYVDGTLQGSATASPVSMTGYWRAGAETMTGWTGNPTDRYFEGNLDELAVYPTALSQARITAHRTAGITP
jgi:signal peptidase I